MTINYGIFDVADPANPDRVYSATLLSRILSKHIRDGVVHGDGAELAVSVTDPPAMQVQVGTGTAMVQGRFCESDASLTLPVTSAHASYPRIDRVVVRLSASPARTIDIVVKPGTAAPSPVPPTLTRTAEVWELSLAQVRVEAGATLIASAKITDERGDASLCGVAAPAYVPSSQLEVVAPVNMQGKALTGLPVPSAATDAARKGYVDAEIAAKIGGFGISQIAIDADKDWNGKSITNVDYIEAKRIRPEASDEVRWGPKQDIWTAGGWSPPLSLQVVIPSIYIEGTAKLTLKGHSYYTDSFSDQQVGIKVNGVSVAQWSSSDGTLHEYVSPIKGGDVIVFWSEKVWGEDGGGISGATVQLSDTAPIIYSEPPTWPA